MKKNTLYLLKSHEDLSDAYINYSCFEQTIIYLTKALKLNGDLFYKVELIKRLSSILYNFIWRVTKIKNNNLIYFFFYKIKNLN